MSGLVMTLVRTVVSPVAVRTVVSSVAVRTLLSP